MRGDFTALRCGCLLYLKKSCSFREGWTLWASGSSIRVGCGTAPPALTVKAEQRLMTHPQPSWQSHSHLAVVRDLLPSLWAEDTREPRPGGCSFSGKSAGTSGPHPLGFQEQPLCLCVRLHTSAQLLLATARQIFLISAYKVLRKERLPTHLREARKLEEKKFMIHSLGIKPLSHMPQMSPDFRSECGP